MDCVDALVIVRSHAIVVVAHRDGGKWCNLNHILQEGFKWAEVVFLGGVVTADDPNLVFFGKESRADKRIDANVNGVISVMGDWRGLQM